MKREEIEVSGPWNFSLLLLLRKIQSHLPLTSFYYFFCFSQHFLILSHQQKKKLSVEQMCGE